ncbi:GNAT family N-acetyltransferase [Arenivirga flava]|uniref:N-acetyltransferase domain-containing protein n=1 Tax=Arenivirga flava TaxID=1930060 RepID=A0AA37UI82_9MICO|nr:GNAT family N-acetyltransferase [Arenivirga flava]GMA29288.1 hypothetical protein GCM10025874_25410 [Arenivirga flava]
MDDFAGCARIAVAGRADAPDCRHDRARSPPVALGDAAIRLADSSDAAALAALRWAWSATPEDRDPDRLARDFVAFMSSTADSHRCVVAERDGALVAMAWVAFTARPPIIGTTGRRSADLQSVFVRPEHRGAGLGVRLVQAAIELARAEGAEHLTVHATPDAAAFYERFGFEPGPTIAQLDLQG